MLRLSSALLRTLTPLALIGLSVFAACQEPWESNPGPRDRNDLPIRFEKVRGAVYSVEDFNYYKTNSAVYLHPDGAYFFDASWSYKTARQMLWKAAANSLAEFRGVVLTSFPLHRSGGLDPFRSERIRIIMNERTPPLMRANWDRLQLGMARNFSTWRPLAPQGADELFRDELTLANGRIRVIFPGAAHTPDNSVVLFVEERVLYGGSLLADPPVFTEFADPSGYAAALDRIAALPFDTVICGHGAALADREILERVRAAARRLL
jgi:glyoxylase-like metal-dependent hydrolase (beta-lactamase superfamily II)